MFFNILSLHLFDVGGFSCGKRKCHFDLFFLKKWKSISARSEGLRKGKAIFVKMKILPLF